MIISPLRNGFPWGYDPTYRGYFTPYRTGSGPIDARHSTEVSGWPFCREFGVSEILVENWKFNIAPENRPSPYKRSLPTTIFQKLC